METGADTDTETSTERKTETGIWTGTETEAETEIREGKERIGDGGKEVEQERRETEREGGYNSDGSGVAGEREHSITDCLRPLRDSAAVNQHYSDRIN